MSLMSMLSTLKDCVEFCYKHQRRRAPDGEIIYKTFNEWASIIVIGAKQNQLYIVENAKRELIGVCVATDRPATKTVWITETVCIENAFKSFIVECFKRWPDYSIKGLRFGKVKHYNKRHLYGRESSTS